MALSADVPPNSAVTRRDAVESANKRFLENRAGWGLGGIGVGLGVTAAAIAIAYRHDVFPGAEKKLALRPFVAPSLSGAMGGVVLSW